MHLPAQSNKDSELPTDKKTLHEIFIFKNPREMIDVFSEIWNFSDIIVSDVQSVRISSFYTVLRPVSIFGDKDISVGHQNFPTQTFVFTR